MKTLLTVVFGASLALLSPAFASTELLVNGGFENAGNGPASGENSSYYNLGPDGSGADHPVPADFGWTVSNGNVDLISYLTYGPAPAAGGSYGLDLVGYGSTGSISQVISTVLGQVYNVSFSYKSNPGIAAPTAAVFDGTNLGSVTGSDSWQTYNSTFVGTGASGVFSLTETYGGNNGGVFLDNVSVTAVPEPAIWLSMIFGFGLLGFALRMRKSVTAFA